MNFSPGSGDILSHLVRAVVVADFFPLTFVSHLRYMELTVTSLSVASVDMCVTELGNSPEEVEGVEGKVVAEADEAEEVDAPEEADDPEEADEPEEAEELEEADEPEELAQADEVGDEASTQNTDSKGAHGDDGHICKQQTPF